MGLLVFAEPNELVPIVHAIAAQPVADDRALHGSFDEPAQLAFGRTAAGRIGYDFERGRLDKTHHPFCTRFSSGDVRITTRVREDDIGEALFSTVHETGHALYEQGVSPDLDGTPLGCGTSAGVPRPGGQDGKGEWGAANPDDPRNRRRRCSILVQEKGIAIIKSSASFHLK